MSIRRVGRIAWTDSGGVRARGVAAAALTLTALGVASGLPGPSAAPAEGSGLVVGLAISPAAVPRDRWLAATIEVTNLRPRPVTLRRWMLDHDTLQVRDLAGAKRPLRVQFEKASPTRSYYFTLRTLERVGWREYIHPYCYYELDAGTYRLVALYRGAPLLVVRASGRWEDLAITESLCPWRQARVASSEVVVRVTPGPALELPPLVRRGRSVGAGVSARLDLESQVAPAKGQLPLSLRLANTGPDPVTLVRWRGDSSSLRITCPDGKSREPTARDLAPPLRRNDFYTLDSGEWVVFRQSVPLSNWALDPGDYHAAAVYRSRALVVEAPKRENLTETEGLSGWDGPPILSNEVTFRVE